MKKQMFLKKTKRLLAMLCASTLLFNICSIRGNAHYSVDRKYMNIPSLQVMMLGDDTVSVVKYQKETNQEPYVLGIPAGINVEARENTQKVIGIENNVFANERFSMIYVETNNGMEIGKNAFNKVTVNYTNSYVTDMDVNFIGGKNKGPITDIGEYAFAYFYVPGGYVHIDNVTGKIGAHAFEQASILESFDIADGLIEEIGESAFRSFHASGFHIPDYKKVDACAFSRANFKMFQLSDKVESIGSRIFEGCDALEEITLPAEDHIKEVSVDAFPDNKGLCINVPAGYEDLSAYHFDQYQNLTFCLSPEYTTESSVYKQLVATGAEVMIQSFTAATVTYIQSPSTTTDPEVTTTQVATTSPESTTTQATTTAPEATTTQATTTEPETTTTQATTTETETTTTQVTTTESEAATTQAATTESEDSAGKTTGSDTSSQSPTVTNVSVITNVASSASASASADKGKKSGKKTSVVGTILTRKGISYRITGKNTAVCIGAASPKKKVTVAASITYKGKSYLVTELGTKAFYMDKTLEYLKLGKNVKKIRSSALEQCTQLKRVTFGRNLTTIEKRAFYKDKNLIRLIFDGEKLRTVGKRAFSKGKKSKKVIVPSTADQKRYYKLLQGSIVD